MPFHSESIASQRSALARSQRHAPARSAEPCFNGDPCLKDRSTLAHAWASPSNTPKQHLHWMYQMLDFWVGLGVLACRASVLRPDNITIDHQSTVCLERLMRDRPSPQSSDLRLSADPIRSSDPLLATPPANTDPRELVKLWQRLEHHPKTETSVLSLLVAMWAEIDRTPNLSVDRLRRILDKYDRQSQTQFPNPLADLLDWTSPLQHNLYEMDGTAADLDDRTLALQNTAQVTSAGMTDVGLRRSHNEDSFAIWERREQQHTPDRAQQVVRGLYVVCDGMGGHASGEVASQLATQTLVDFFQSQWSGSLPATETVRDGIVAANRAVYQANAHAQGARRMGTTLVALWLHDINVTIAHVGDSRIYRYTRSYGLEQLTIDHDVAQESIRSGLSPSRAHRLPEARHLTRAIGPQHSSELVPEIQTFTLSEDTIFLLASDGLTDNEILERDSVPPFAPLLAPEADLDIAAQTLIDFANRTNGHDNTTVILVRALLEG